MKAIVHKFIPRLRYHVKRVIHYDFRIPIVLVFRHTVRKTLMALRRVNILKSIRPRTVLPKEARLSRISILEFTILGHLLPCGGVITELLFLNPLLHVNRRLTRLWLEIW